MTASAPATTPAKRTASPAERRAQLIKATIRSVAKRGLSDTTMATVAKEAGLSQGIINLHFKSKDRLLVETLTHLADEYRGTWEKRLDAAGTSSAARLRAMIGTDFSLPVCASNKLAVWFAFWSEAKARPTYRKLCAARDQEYGEAMLRLCQEIVREHGYRVDPVVVSTTLAALTDGLWLDLLLAPRDITRQQAESVCLRYVACVFPGLLPD
jgi:TetR/AcrR family transcriptional repressor of bet genes